MGKKKSWVQLFLVWIMLFQYGSSTIYAVAMEENQSLNQTMHVIKVSEEKNSDRRQVETLIEESGIEKDSYTIQEPIALFSVTQEGLTEEHYYPVLSQKKLATLIRYTPKTESYALEAEQVVKKLADYQGETKNTAPLVLLEVEQQIIGKDEKSVYNFSTPEMSESETEQLFLQADISKINLSNTMDLYEEKEEQTENSREDATQVTEETSILDSSLEESETSATREVSEESWTSETSSEVTQEQSVIEKKTDDSKAENKKTTEKESKSELRNMPLPLEPSRLRQNNSMFAQSIPLQLNQSSSGNISLIGEKKYYQFKVPERQVGTIYDKYTMYTTSNFDSYGTLYDSEGKVIGSNDDGNGNRDFKIIKEDLQPGIYYLEVRELSNTGTGSYVVRVDRELGQDENYDHGTAVPLPINKDYPAGTDFKGDKDYYRIEVPERQTGTIYDKYTMYTTSNFDSYGTLYDSEGKVIGSNDDGNGNRDFKIIKEDLQPGIYYLEVRELSNTGTGSYVVRVDRELGQDENYDHGTAVPLPINKDYPAGIDFKGDKDYYRIEVPERQTGTIYDKYTMYTTSEFDSYGTLYDSEGKVIGSNDDGNGNRDFKIIKEDLQPGIYYLEVRELSNTGTGSYVVRVDRELGQDENYDHGTAALLPINKDYPAGIDFKGDKDYYRIEVPERQTGTIYDKYTMYTTSEFDSYGTLYDSEGKVIGSNDDGNGNRDFKIIKEDLQPGIYYLEVRELSNTGTGSYVVRVDRELGQDENYDHGTAVPLPINKDYPAGIDFKGDKDYYRIEVPERQTGTIYDKYIMYATGDFDNYGTLYTSEGEVVASDDDSNGNRNFKITKENLRPGIYYLEVKGYADSKVGSYSVRIDTEETLKQKPIRINSTGSYSGSIGATDKEQIKRYEFFVWDKPQGTVFREHEFSFKSDLFGTMTLLDENQKTITTLNHNGQALDSKILKELQAGKYYLEVKTQGNFSFKINEQNISNDSNRNFKEAKLLIKNQKITDTIDFGEVSKYAGDEDYFKIFIPSYEHGKYNIQLSGDTEVIGQLYNDQEESISGDFKNTLTKKLTPGIYYVKVRGKNANVRGSYQVSFTGEDAFEDAINLPLNETMQDDLSDVKGAQYYKFQVSDVQKLEFYLAHSAPTTIEVYDQNHKKMIGKTWETTNHKVSGTFLPGMYYIKIASKSATKYKLLIDTVQRNENQIELVQVGMSMQVHLNGVASPELTQFFYKRFGARSLLLPGSFSVLDFMKGLVTEWTINTGGVQILDALFGTDRTGYLKDWQGKSKEYVLGLYVGDAISLVQGAVTLVGAGMFLVGGNLMGIAGAPFTGGASLTICAVSTTVTVAAAVQGSAMVISAAKNMSNGHHWDPELDSDYVKLEGRGSTGRTEPNDIAEKIAMDDARRKPFDSIKGEKDIDMVVEKLSDSRWKDWEKWQIVYRTKEGRNINIHFSYDPVKKLFDDFKFK